MSHYTKIEEKVRCAQMKRLASKALTGEEDLGIMGDLARIALEEGHLEIAAEYSEGAISKISEKYDA